MSEEIETLKAPNWLNELEKKREIRLKARLGHEAGAGAPCLKCTEKCPGLDLHFWRKICKNCKCSKEDHDVHDDDIYGWAQFQLLGSKPNKIKKKIVLPGKKDEVELDWAPKGHIETVDRYLQTLPPESLPVKGSQAAQERKHLLQKQIPIHDLDPTLCHELTDSERKKMQDYIEHMKTSSVGVGQVIQMGLHRGTMHQGGHVNASVISNRYPKELSTIETVKLHGETTAAPLIKQMETLGVRDQKELDAFFDTVPKPINMTSYINQLDTKNRHYTLPINHPHAANFAAENITNNPVEEVNRNVAPDEVKELPHYAPSKLNIHSDQQNPKMENICDLIRSTYSNNPPMADLANSNYKNLQSFSPSQSGKVPEDQLVPNIVNIGGIRDITYENTNVKQAERKNNPQILDDVEVSKSEAGVVAPPPKCCRKCTKCFNEDEFAIFVERCNGLYHSHCFKCAGCNQNLADMVYFYDKDSDNIYCGRDYAKIRGIPRCKACDELIFVKEYCLAENCTFHVKHFCCFECDTALAGQNYVVEESQPVCLPCFEALKAEKCSACLRAIKPDERGAKLEEVHFHANDECFGCRVCRKPLLGQRFLFRNRKLYCSHECLDNDPC